MASVFNLEIYSTGGCFYKGACEHLVFESVDGSRGVMAGHEPVICALKRGEIRFLADGEWQKVAVTEGFVEIMPDFVRLFADTAVKAEKVEEYRAERERARAQERQRQKLANKQYINSHLSLKRARGKSKK